MDDPEQDLRRRVEEGYFLQNVDPGAFDLMEHREQWGTAVILDACRFDTFEKVIGKRGQAPFSNDKRGPAGKRGLAPFSPFENGACPLLPKISVASCTEDWVLRCLDRPLEDVAYISASPYISRWYLEQVGIPMRLGHLEEVWKHGWDDQLHTVPPQAVAEAFHRLRAEFVAREDAPTKFVLHFMQPHQPFIGQVRLAKAGWRKYFGAMELDVAELEGQTPIEMLEDGCVSRAEVEAAYESNLELVLQAVCELLPDLPRPVVVTADHGEALGECGVFGHPCGLPLPELIEVPYWIVG